MESNVQNVAEALDEVTQNLNSLTSENIEDLAATFQSIVDVESAEPEVFNEELLFSREICYNSSGLHFQITWQRYLSPQSKPAKNVQNAIESHRRPC